MVEVFAKQSFNEESDKKVKKQARYSNGADIRFGWDQRANKDAGMGCNS